MNVGVNSKAEDNQSISEVINCSSITLIAIDD
jgi:hypothetical protein